MGAIITVEANCRDCYKCVRNCPVKAIRIVGNHSLIIDEMCIGDANCVKVCPQKSKQAKSSVEEVEKILEAREIKVLSIAPTFAAAFDITDPLKIVTAAKKLGFDFVLETAQAAGQVARAHLDAMKETKNPVLSTSCPVIVNYVERYKPEFIPHLAPVLSPMVAHSKMIKHKYGEDCKIVFMGPCIEKKDEALRETSGNNIDAVLTFVEFKGLLKRAHISLESLEPGPFDGAVKGRARLYPIEGGMLLTAGVTGENVTSPDLTITGIDDCIEFIDNLNKKSDLRLVELMSCSAGCINGPGVESSDDIYRRRRKIVNFENKVSENQEYLEELSPEEVKDKFKSEKIELPEPSEEQIREILVKTDKKELSDELNCGACGYNSCRDKAKAVFNGMAELEMCLPFMKQRAESMSTLIINTMPNGVVVVDRNYKIINVNPSFESMFDCREEEVVGVEISKFMDLDCFEKVFETKQTITKDASYHDGAFKARLRVFYVGKRDSVVAILSDLTQVSQQREMILKAREETIIKTSKVINRQMQVAQEIAGLLGETTAETKVLLTQLMKQLQSEELAE